MELTNATPFPMHVHRDYTDDCALLVATAKTTFDVSTDGQLRFARHQRAICTDGSPECPLSEAPFRRPEGVVEVTIHGRVLPESGGRLTVQDLSLDVGRYSFRLRVHGLRRWIRSGSELVPSAPQPVESVELAWPNAFGGSKRVPPGLIPGTSLPAPTTQVSWPANPQGTGFYTTEEEASGKLLAQIEDPAWPVQRWTDRPQPKCWAPMPLATSLRMDGVEQRDGMLRSRHPGESLISRATMIAPPELQLTDVAFGAEVRLRGFGVGSSLRFVLPAAPCLWNSHSGSRTQRVAPTLAHVQVFPDSRQIACLYRARLTIPLIRHQRRGASLHMGPGATAMAPGSAGG
jgi:hypothetical protein